ncbi:MAG: hypothetical protein PHF86_01045 [Candidatus Nanoarchaeia archaeon]|nr:hypothetical protein [Candidatus Nanoarchaeia archaeon]
MENSLSKLETKAKGIFDQKGGTLGMVLLAIGVIFFLIKLPAIVSFVDSLFHLIITCVATAGILYLLFDKKIRKVVGTLYMMGIRYLMGCIIKMNPIAILEDTIIKMYKTIQNGEQQMGKLNGNRMKLKEKINTRKRELEDCLNRKSIAEKQQKKEVMVLEDRQSVRLVNLIKEYMSLYESTEEWYKNLSRLVEFAKLNAQDAENEVAIQKERYEIIRASHNAFRSAMSIIKGDPDELALYNQAFQYVNDDIMEKVGEMDRVINSTGGMMDKMDIEKEVFAIKGDEISKKYQELGIDALFTKFEALPSKQIKSTITVEDAVIIPTSTNLVSTQKSKYFN